MDLNFHVKALKDLLIASKSSDSIFFLLDLSPKQGQLILHKSTSCLAFKVEILPKSLKKF